MKTRQQAAREYADKACDTTPRKNDGYPLTRTLGELKDDAIQDFLAGCEHADKEHRDFYLLVRSFFIHKSTAEDCDIDEYRTQAINGMDVAEYAIRKHLAAFTEREQQSLPFKD